MDPDEALATARLHVEYYFSADELCKNVFIRRHMDVDGYVPAALVFNFPGVVRLGIPYSTLLECMTSSDCLDADIENETLRIKSKTGDGSKYKKWLFPNELGEYGCPRWIKAPAEKSNAAISAIDKIKKVVGVNQEQHENHTTQKEVELAGIKPGVSEEATKSYSSAVRQGQNGTEKDVAPDLVCCSVGSDSSTGGICSEQSV